MHPGSFSQEQPHISIGRIVVNAIGAANQKVQLAVIVPVVYVDATPVTFIKLKSYQLYFSSWIVFGISIGASILEEIDHRIIRTEQQVVAAVFVPVNQEWGGPRHLRLGQFQGFGPTEFRFCFRSGVSVDNDVVACGACVAYENIHQTVVVVVGNVYL